MAATAVTQNQYDVHSGSGGDPVKAFTTFYLHPGYSLQISYFGTDLFSVTVRNLLNSCPTYYDRYDAINNSQQDG